MVVSGWYMASTSNIPTEYRDSLGHIEGQNGIRPVALRQCRYFCLDNSVFTGAFQEEKWIKRIESIRPYKDKCLFVTIPDVVKDCIATLEQFSYYRNMVKDFPVAFVSQDGISKFAHKIPWDDFDCVFVGGSDEHKLGKEVWWVIEQARKRNKWIHIGRVNSVSRMMKFYMADSWDGTCLSFCPSNAKRFHDAVLRIRNRKEMRGFFDENYQKNSFDGDYLGAVLRSDHRAQSD